MTDTPEKRLKALAELIERRLSEPKQRLARTMLDAFIEFYRLNQKVKDGDDDVVELWHRWRMLKLGIAGGLLDIVVNYTVGVELFEDYVRWPTLTATLKRTLKKAPIISQEWQDAKLICSVLEDIDPGHCKLAKYLG